MKKFFEVNDEPIEEAPEYVAEVSEPIHLICMQPMGPDGFCPTCRKQPPDHEVG